MPGRSAETYGVSVTDEECNVCVLSVEGEVAEESRVPMTRLALLRYFKDHKPARVVLEVGLHSSSISRLLKELGYEVIVANARRVKLMSGGSRTSDRLDAELLARLGRADPRLLSTIRQRRATIQADIAVVRSRTALVHARTNLILFVRHLVRAQGFRIPSCPAGSFYHRACVSLPAEFCRSLTPVLESIEKLCLEIRACTQMIQNLCEIKYPAALPLMQVPGVGLVTAFTFILLLEGPMRFRNCRAVTVHLGLVPGHRRSGETGPRPGIIEGHDRAMRALLVQSACYIMGPNGHDSALRRKGLHLAAAGDRRARKRAAVAVARQLACVLYQIWATNEPYQPFPRGIPERS